MDNDGGILDLGGYSIPVSTPSGKKKSHKKEKSLLEEVYATQSSEDVEESSSEGSSEQPKDIRSRIENMDFERKAKRASSTTDAITLVPYYSRVLDLHREKLPTLTSLMLDSKKVGIILKPSSGERRVTRNGIVTYTKRNHLSILWSQVSTPAMKKHAKLIKGLGIPWEIPYLHIPKPWHKYMKRCISSENSDLDRTFDIVTQMRQWMLLMNNPTKRGVTVISSKDGELAKAMAGQLVYRSILVNPSKPGVMYPVFKGYRDRMITGEVKAQPLTVLYGFGEDSEQSLLDNVTYLVNTNNDVHIVICAASSNPLNFARKIGVSAQRAFRLSRHRSTIEL